MTTDTAVAESETGVSEFPPSPIAEETLAALPELRYLFVDGMPVRPPTEEEKASYAARYADGTWADLNDPGEPHVILPPSSEVAQLTEIAAGAAEPAQPPDPDASAFGADQVQEDALAALNRWTKATKKADPELPAPPAGPEIHPTAVLPALPESGQ